MSELVLERWSTEVASVDGALAEMILKGKPSRPKE